MSIQILPAQLANQIAAGEVVERPASVVKELVENSLDAGADQIDIEIEKGGHKRILIRDNGKGIARDELGLALSRHATSKIGTLDDLECIVSLGFRGEALASVSSVARLILTSRPPNQSEAWQARAEGRDMAVDIQPAAHPVGTTVDVVDLFYNTPARRKFLRTEKTEFQHIDEVLRRIALSRFDVAFSLKHNGKVLRRFPRCNSEDTRLKRVATIAGNEFAQQALVIHSDYQSLKLDGWLLPPQLARAQNDGQYVYVNGRMMRDKLIYHAIRQAFEGLVDEQRYPAFVLFLSLDADQVDVNVHPAKHEVRFHQARLVHDFIYRALDDVLQHNLTQVDQSAERQTLAPAVPDHDYISPLRPARSDHQISDGGSRPAAARSGATSAPAAGYSRYQQLMSPQTSADPTQSSHYWLLDDGMVALFDEGQLRVCSAQQVIEVASRVPEEDKAVVSQPLLMPVSVSADSGLLHIAQQRYEPLLALGIDIGWTGQRIMVRKVPAGMRQQNWADILPRLLSENATPPFDQAWLQRVLHPVSDNIDENQLTSALKLLRHDPEGWQTLLQRSAVMPVASWWKEQHNNG
ncbi:DNA mismatch repair endonuclease MutL [Aestuariibacter halophilus]|uniref:DNA mismatch repair protein MutL n=1 Tax=Fluctibacter halophilus TaxID=226011 RepID=A0ABS8GD41_9ALTE|nr:DNA mismatch repair endonuclease MutL [Aestuariibacter halophilus]MCC2617709.1 DNA mismatch repair endonuclease MutL [Aestuariibacter halophilus]